MINPYLLEQLLTFYKTGTLSAAAEELFISQPALSQSMQKLEEMVGVPLFIRQKNKMDFNENGRLLAEYAQKILALQKEMVSAVKEQASHQTSLHLASIAPGPFYLLLPKLTEEFPKLKITSDLVNSEEKLLAGLLADQYDLVITHQPNRNDQLTYQPYFSETLSMRLSKSHPLANRNQLTFADLAGQNILLLSDIGFWTEMIKSQIPSANFLYMENTAAFTDVANMGTFPTFISTVAAPPKDPNYKIIPLAERLATAQFYFLLKKANLYKWQNLIEKVQTSLE